MKVTKIETFSCDGGWRTQSFVKISTDEGIVGYAEANCLHSAPMPSPPIPQKSGATDYRDLMPRRAAVCHTTMQ